MWRREAPHVRGALLRRYGHADACDDAVQEAAEAAVTRWPVTGVPDDPRAWLVRVASRRLIDRLRADTARTRRETLDAARRPDAGVAPAADDTPAPAVDDTLRLLFLCCHPALSRPSQVALTLRAVAGLPVAQIAAAFAVPARTMTQRLNRARSALRQAGARFTMPPPRSLPDRVAAVLDVCHLVFTEGYTRTCGDSLVDGELAEEAIRLTRQIHTALPGHHEVTGALALMLLTHARSPARTDSGGDLVPLAEQDRSRWRRDLIDEGVTLLGQALPRGPVGRYQLQAAIAAVHAEAPTFQATDWRQISVLYDMLSRVAPSPFVTLNQAVAVAMAHGPALGLALLDPLLTDAAMLRHHRLHAVRAHLLELNGEPDAAAEHYRRAARLTASLPEQRYLNRRLTGP
ncbi:sigma-70 family RNA polymerase sigma factor [Micromonospora sp. WMMC241]|uniref:RNA polymerase sigma factor n=1 Tax=Micromonospora sp. WMMC241 TaxID=3015159 RepID=UPI0022B6385B|nr:sigma-70 family RNA polymerase sigma factor [Micromonospora sp. WMMC241]MCZ7437511.1 sigma-70 family RNA polymerase sigma factor [Micromonospora sp. WMMC241]